MRSLFFHFCYKQYHTKVSGLVRISGLPAELIPCGINRFLPIFGLLHPFLLGRVTVLGSLLC